MIEQPADTSYPAGFMGYEIGIEYLFAAEFDSLSMDRLLDNTLK